MTAIAMVAMFGLMSTIGLFGLVLAADQGQQHRYADKHTRFMDRVLGYSSAYVLAFSLLALGILL